MTQNEVREQLNRLREQGYQKFSAALIPGVERMLGIRIPKLRQMAKEIAKSDWKSIKTWKEPLYFEEHMLQGMVIGYAKADFVELKEAIAWFIPTVDNWSINDSFCSGLKITKKHLPEMWNFLMSYSSSKKEYEIRVVAIMLMDYYLVDDYIDQVLITLSKLPVHGYYTSMGVAWAYATAWAKYPQKTKEFLLEHAIDEETLKRTLQKCRESYRVSGEDKIFIKKQWS